jgi:hypothetical protein
MADHLLDTMPGWDNAGLPFEPPLHRESPRALDTPR